MRALPYHDDTILGLVTQLVAARAECFVGTLYSTFSALIQRLRGYLNRKPEFLYCYSDWEPELVPFQLCEFLPLRDGPYSWNRIPYPVCPSVNSWFREWPESFDGCPDAAAIPGQTIELRASEAHIHGVEARYERTPLHDNIGYWNNPDDYVTWDFSLAQSAVCRVEMRYACSSQSAGSNYCLEIDRDLLAGTVLGTGGWSIFSDWQTVGVIYVAEGHHILSVRALTMPAFAVMNLAGIRIVPIRT